MQLDRRHVAYILTVLALIGIYIWDPSTDALQSTVSAMAASHTGHLQQPAAVLDQALPALVIRGVARNHSSVRVHFQPVDGAVDYRIYDVTNPSLVKYAGTRHYTTEGAFGFRDNPSTGDIRWPLEVASNSPAGGGHSYPIVLDAYPISEIEWNELGDGLVHTLIVEAVDALGPVSDANTYDFTSFDPTVPGSMSMGMNKGPTADGKVTLNGQGDRLNNPQAIARSVAFTAQADTSYAALPSGLDADGVFYDTFANVEAGSLHQTFATPLCCDPPGGHQKTYVLNDGDATKGWNIHYQSASVDTSFPFISSNHYMDVLFDQFAGASWATMAMQPQRDWDLSGGHILHATFESDSAMDIAGRRWLGVDFAPAASPLTSFVTGNLETAPLNTSHQSLFMEIYSTAIRYRYFTGPSTTPGIPVEVDLEPCRTERGQHFHDSGRGWDNRSRFDVYLTQQRILVLEDGVLINQCVFPVALPWSQTTAYFSHYFYHSAADLVEEPYIAPWNRYLLDRFPESEERHWDNMGMERLPSSAETNWNNPVSLIARSQPILPAVEQCPAGWTCADVGAYAPVYPSSVEQRGPQTYAVHSAGAPVDDENMLYGMWQTVTGNTAMRARLQDHANLSYWGVTGQAGVMLRETLDPNSALYAVLHHQDGTIHVVGRATTGGALTTLATTGAVALPIHLRATRTGTTLSADYSTDGVSWTPVGGGGQTGAWAGGYQGVTDWEQQYNIPSFFPQVGTAEFDLSAAPDPPATPTITPTLAATATATVTRTPTRTFTPVPTATFPPSPTAGASPTRTNTPTTVPTAVPPTATQTRTPTATRTPTRTPTPGPALGVPYPLPLISGGAPASASSDNGASYVASQANNSLGFAYWITSTLPAWVAYDLSGVSAPARGPVIVHWYAAAAYLMQGGTPYSYQLQGNAAAGGGSAPSTGWVTLASQTTNTYSSYQHQVNLTGYNWLRMYVDSTDGGGGSYVSLHMNVHDARNSLTLGDDWIVFGDTNYGAFYPGQGDPNVAGLITAGNGAYTPIMQGAAVGGTTTGYIQTMLPTFLPNFPGRYVVLGYGTNDAVFGTTDPVALLAAETAAWEDIVGQVFAAGKIPVIPHIPYGTAGGLSTNGPVINAYFDTLYAKYPAIQAGPDLWAYFAAHPECMDPDGTHTSGACMRDAWATWALANIYTGSLVPTPTATPSPTPSPTVTRTPTPGPTATATPTGGFKAIRVIDSDGGLNYRTLMFFPIATPKQFNSQNVVPSPSNTLDRMASLVAQVPTDARAALDAGTMQYAIVPVTKVEGDTDLQFAARLQAAYTTQLALADAQYTIRYQHLGTALDAP